MRELKSEIKEIIQNSKGIYHTKDMLLIVQEYIRLRKGVEVKLNFNPDNPIDLNLLMVAFDYAISWISKEKL